MSKMSSSWSNNYVIELKDVTLQYPGTIAVEKVSGFFQKNKMTAIIGPNGGGKSSLIKAIMGLMPLHSGQIILNGFDKKNMAYLPQQSQVDRSFPLSVYEVVGMGLSQTQGFFNKIQASEQIDEALEKIGLTHYKNRSIRALSGGQFQKVLFARLWVQQADIILLDEPFTGIDRHTTEDIIELLKKWILEGKTIIAVLHHFDLVKNSFPQSLLLARRLIEWGDTASVLTPNNLAKAIDQSRFWETYNSNQSGLTPQILTKEP